MKHIRRGRIKPYAKSYDWRFKYSINKDCIIGCIGYAKSKQQKLIARNANRSVKKAYRQKLRYELKELINEI